MNDFSLLIGGKAGDGIDTAGPLIGRIFSQLGYRIYIYRDYPSLIRGGHTFAIIRACRDKIAAHANKVDFVLALNQETLDLHRARLKDGCFMLYDADHVKSDFAGCAIGLSMGKILKEELAAPIMRNSCLIGGFCKAAGIEWPVVESAFRKNIAKEIDSNLKVARRGYDEAKELVKINEVGQTALPILSGNEAIGLGLIKGGMEAYVAYPMTPASGILHFFANTATDFPIKVVHPESEIAVILMALGFSYAGEKVAVGTSGGGFCLMNEGLSFAGMAELPVVIFVGQRPSPSTGLPTYTAQTDLHFVLNAGQGEFPRLVIAPGDAEEAYYWSAISMNLAWKYQIPAIILGDKTLGEGAYSFDISLVKKIEEELPSLWDGKGTYKRYSNSETGVSPLAFVPRKDAVIKINSYEHDENGITTEEPQLTTLMQDKRLRKEGYLAEELRNYETVGVYGNKDSSTAVLCWGSNKGVCVEAAQNFGLKVIQPVVLSPFPLNRFLEPLNGVKRLICVENNATGQLVSHINRYGLDVDEKILKYDGRPFALDELVERLKQVMK